MLGNVYLKTLRDLRGQVAVWGLGLAVLAAANILLFPTMQSMKGLVDFLEGLPAGFKALIGDVRQMAQLAGFLRVKLFEPLPLLLAVFVIPQCARQIAGELEDRSIDLLMARPIRRWRVVLAKYLAVATAAVTICVPLAASLLICRLVVETDLGPGYLILATASALPLTWLFGGLALLGSCLLPRSRPAATLAGTVVVASYVLEALRLLSPALHGWRPVSLFAYQKASFTLAGHLVPGPILLLLGIAALLVAAAAVAWERRDLAG